MDQVMQFEIQITLFIQHIFAGFVNPFKAITFLGNEEFYLVVMPALYWCIDATLGFRLGVMLVMTNSINGYIKVLFHSPRPFWMDSRVKAYISETSFGFPSGHSQNAAAMWGMMAASLKKKWATSVCVVIIFLIGLSRIFLGIHFTRDVIGGWIIGLLLVFLYLLIEKPLSSWIGAKSLLYKISVSFLVSLLIIALGYLINAFFINWQIPAAWVHQALASGAEAPEPFSLEGNFTIAGVWFGFTTGYAWLLQRKGKVIVQGSIGKRIGRYFVGLFGVGILYLGLKLVFPATPDVLGFALRYLRYALIGLWVTAIAPILFERLHLDA